MPTITLSEDTLALLRVRLTGGSSRVDDSNRELARAGIMYPVSGFTTPSAGRDTADPKSAK